MVGVGLRSDGKVVGGPREAPPVRHRNERPQVSKLETGVGDHNLRTLSVSYRGATTDPCRWTTSSACLSPLPGIAFVLLRSSSP